VTVARNNIARRGDKVRFFMTPDTDPEAFAAMLRLAHEVVFGAALNDETLTPEAQRLGTDAN
jgi:hypothetical protein